MNKKSLAIGAIILAVLAVGVLFFVVRSDKENEVLSDALSVSSISADHYFGGDNTHIVEGKVSLPTPCYEVSVDARIAESFPEQVTLAFTAKKTADVCAQMIYDAPFSIAFQSSQQARIAATFDGKPVELKLTEKPGSVEKFGTPFTLKVGESRWVNEAKITFKRVESDSRCPSDPQVRCVWAGEAKVLVSLNDEELSLVLPGEKAASIAGSYIVTLISLEPSPREGMNIQEGAYTATFRIDVHDSKG